MKLPRLAALLLFATARTLAADNGPALKTGLFDVKLKTEDPAGLVDFNSLAVLKVKDGYALANKSDEGTWTLLGVLKRAGSIQLPKPK